MEKIYELRKRRAELWNDAKIFLDGHRGSDGCLSDEDSAVYDKMEADVVRLGMEIQRLESQAHIDRDILREEISDMKYEEPVLECQKTVTVAGALQEANKILGDMGAMLAELEHVTTGSPSTDDGTRKTAQCLQEEATFLTGMAYECLCKVRRIKEALV